MSQANVNSAACVVKKGCVGKLFGGLEFIHGMLSGFRKQNIRKRIDIWNPGSEGPMRVT